VLCESEMSEEEDIAAVMGFSGFGKTCKGRSHLTCHLKLALLMTVDFDHDHCHLVLEADLSHREEVILVPRPSPKSEKRVWCSEQHFLSHGAVVSEPDPRKIGRRVWEIGWGRSVPSGLYGICNY